MNERPISAYRTLVVLQPTPFCNIDCKYCYLPDRKNTNTMTEIVIERIACEILSSDLIEFPIVFLWHLGEPLAVPRKFYDQAFEIIAKVNKQYKREYVHSFQTNGMLINQDWINLFLHNDVRIGISIDGPDFIHDRQRVTRDGRGTHAEVMKGIKLLKNAKIPFGVIAVLTDYSLDYPEEMYQFFIDNNIDDVAFNIDEIDGMHKFNSFSKSTSIDRYKQFLLKILDLASLQPEKFKIREIWTNLRTLSLGNKNPYNTTNQPLRIINISANGDFSTFCPELRAARSDKFGNFKMGNLVSGQLSDIFENPIFKLVNDEIQKGVGMCAEKCEYWSFCGGGSPSNKFFEFGRFDVEETNTCRLHKMATIDTLMTYIEHRLAPNNKNNSEFSDHVRIE